MFCKKKKKIFGYKTGKCSFCRCYFKCKNKTRNISLKLSGAYQGSTDPFLESELEKIQYRFQISDTELMLVFVFTVLKTQLSPVTKSAWIWTDFIKALPVAGFVRFEPITLDHDAELCSWQHCTKNKIQPNI